LEVNPNNGAAGLSANQSLVTSFKFIITPINLHILHVTHYVSLR